MMKSENNLPIGEEKKLAEFLKEKRQSKNLSLERLGEITKIQIYHLKSLEDGKFENLPPSVYRAGIFKRLAKFLEIDEDKIIEMYKNEVQNDVDTPVVKDVSSKKKFYFILTPKKVSLFLGGLLLVLLSFYLWYQFNFLVGPPTLVIESKQDISTKDEILPLKGRTDSGVNLTINGENVYVDSNGSFSKNIQLAAGINIIEIKAVNNFGKVSTIVRQIFKEQIGGNTSYDNSTSTKTNLNN